MNRSRYVTRPIDATDRAIIAALVGNGRMTVRELAEQIGMSSPSVTERIHKLEMQARSANIQLLLIQ